MKLIHFRVISTISDNFRYAYFHTWLWHFRHILRPSAHAFLWLVTSLYVFILSFQFDRFLCAKEIHPDHGGRPFCLITDGPLHLRLCIHPEASNKTMPLPHYMYRYFNLRNEFKKFYKTNTINCIKDMLDCILSKWFLSYNQRERFVAIMFGLRQWTDLTMHLFHIPQCTHSEQKCTHFCSVWCIVGYGTGALCDLWIGPIGICWQGKKGK